jgi:NAD(P)-dependent dehydrogenase (short-subunit alcohol dehydrogenase family)
MLQRLLLSITVVLLIPAGVTSIASAQESDDAVQKAVLVTGASSGIGRNLTEKLAAEGYFVYAGARKQADLDALNKIPNVRSVRLDVTRQDEIDAAVETVRAGGKGLYGIVNNAGIVLLGPMTEIEEDELEWIMNVNVMGVYRITKAFAPFVIESEGRIVNISSISGVLSGRFWAPYTMSKHAIEAYTVALAGEMELFNVKVSGINPGNYKSKIGTSEADVLAKKPYAQPGSPYAEAIAGNIEYLSDRSMYKEPDEVSAAIMDALFSDSPKPSYLVVPNEQEANWTIRRLITKTAEFNADQPYTYSDEELIEMLKEATAAQRDR